jgi:hypothetical protein
MPQADPSAKEGIDGDDQRASAFILAMLEKAGG